MTLMGLAIQRLCPPMFWRWSSR